MKKSYIVILFLIVSVVLLVGVFVGKYNNLVDLSEGVSNKYADIQVQLERRMDLIPNLVSTVKGYIQHEENIINKIAEAREKLADSSTVSEQSEANAQLTSAINNLYVIVENYPDLKADQNFIQLQDELAGTENRIAVARIDYNNSVKIYNSEIKKFPTMIVASVFGYKEKEYFSAKDNANEVPNVDFE